MYIFILQIGMKSKLQFRHLMQKSPSFSHQPSTLLTTQLGLTVISQAAYPSCHYVYMLRQMKRAIMESVIRHQGKT